MAAEHIRHWKIGDVEVARIVEVNNWEDDIAMLLPDGKPEYVQKFPWLLPHFATPAGKMLISFQCFVLRSRDKRRDDRHLHRQRPGARVSGVLQPADDVPARISPPPASRRTRSTPCYARTCTSTMSAGIHAR